MYAGADSGFFETCWLFVVVVKVASSVRTFSELIDNSTKLVHRLISGRYASHL